MRTRVHNWALAGGRSTGALDLTVVTPRLLAVVVSVGLGMLATVVAGLNALLTAVFSVLFVTQAVTVGFDSLTRNNLPAEIFFLAFVPAVAGVTLHSTLKRGSVA